MCVDKVTFEKYSATQDTRVVENLRILRHLVLFQMTVFACKYLYFWKANEIVWQTCHIRFVTRVQF